MEINNQSSKYAISRQFLLILISLLLFAQPINAEEPQPSRIFSTLPAMVDCGSPENVSAFLEEYGEKEMAIGKSIIRTPQGAVLTGDMSFYFNPETTSYSIVVKLLDANMWCIMNLGSEFAPYVDAEKL
jgi:hypothetical protein